LRLTEFAEQAAAMVHLTPEERAELRRWCGFTPEPEELKPDE
jgi:hypothetical protein